jgi:transposase-like protein
MRKLTAAVRWLSISSLAMLASCTDVGLKVSSMLSDAKRIEAIWLILVRDYSQRQAAAVVGAHHTTVGRWLRRYNLHHLTKKSRPKIRRYEPQSDNQVAARW